MFGTYICYADETPKTLIPLLNSLRDNGDLSNEKFQAITHKNAEKLLGI